MTIAQTQMEAVNRPSITALTMMCADQNRPKIDRSEEASGNTDCVTSAAFMGDPLGCRVPSVEAAAAQVPGTRTACRARHHAGKKYRRIRDKTPRTAGT